MKKITTVVWIFLAFIVTRTVSGTVKYKFPFWNPSLSWDTRVNDLISRLTDEEIVLQLARGGAGKYGGPAPAIPRLGIKPYQWNTECLRGDAQTAGNATAFPQSIGLAAAFSPQLIRNVAAATAMEVRAKHNDFMKRGMYFDHTGLSCFSPVINIMRHPLWGRNQETYGEDPFLSGVYAEHFVAGIQGKHPRYLQTNAGCKHFDAHGGPENIPVPRVSFDAKVSMQDWRLTFLPQFEACVKAGVHSVMCSYNSINGIPACANSELLTEILRKEWKFTGYVVSDEGAIEYIIDFHKYLNNSLDTAVACIEAGTNLELSGNDKNAVYLSLLKAVKIGRITRELLNERARPLFNTRMRLGEFDPAAMNPYANVNLSVVESVEHRMLAVEAAIESFILLKNMNSFLPLLKKYENISIIGPMANNTVQLFGSYAARTDKFYKSTPLSGLSMLGDKVYYAAGCTDTPCETYHRDSVIRAVQNSHLTILCLGTGIAVETENHDRLNLKLPGKQNELINDVVLHSGGEIILLLFSGGPVDIQFPLVQEKIPAILQCGFPAQATGDALLRLLTGDRANPAARLPYTWYKDLSQVPPMVDYSMKNRTYRYFTGLPTFPFGYGLSYTNFHYSSLRTSFIKMELLVQVTVENIGSYDGDEVVQVYLLWLEEPQMPNIQLIAFDRVFIPKKSRQTKVFMIKVKQLSVWDKKHGFIYKKGSSFILSVGGQQPHQQIHLQSNILSDTITIPQ
ncbi:uncharacterized protein LOC141906236 isoform X2 [Tubulanus polymorphus]